MSSRTRSRDNRSSLLAMALIVFAAPAIAGADAPSGDSLIPWRQAFEAARDEARERGRPLWLQFSGSWCTFCRKMDLETLSQPAVAAFSFDDFVPVKIQSDNREDLLELFQIRGLPATVIVTPEGRTLVREEGFQNPAAFEHLLSQAHQRFDAGQPADEAVPLGLGGCDPVELVQHNQRVPGRPELAVRCDGQEFRFADENGRRAFITEPQRFLPCGKGRCLVSQVEGKASRPGDPRFGVYYKEYLYLCADEAARAQFAANPERYASADLAEGGLCPHCRVLAGQAVKGSPRFSWFHEGRRYLFPDALHRSAFLSAPEQFLR